VRVESSFEVPADREAAWALLMDVPRVVPCMPGATLVDEIDDSTWKANMNVKLGPIGLTFASDVRREVADESEGRVVLAVDARETRGRGSARATIESSLSPADGGTSVAVVADLNLSGKVAQYGRGIVEDVTKQLVAQFADCLSRQLGERGEADGAEAQAPPAAGSSIAGGRLVFRALWSSFVGLFRRG
jgi:uncharacterized protein